MSEHDEIRVEIDATLPRGWLKAVAPDGKTLGTLRGRRPSQDEGQFCQRRRVTLKVVTFSSIMDCLERLYAETRFSPDYLFLNEADYEHLQYNDPHIAQMRRFSTRDAANVNRRGYVVKIASPASGKAVYLATLPDLQEGEVMVLYPYD